MTKKILAENVRYEAKIGKLFWKKKGFGRTVGKQLGGSHHSGYLYVTINNKSYSIHRLIWLLENGAFPKKHIDHINGIRDDNRICNLREASPRDNCCNTYIHRAGRLYGTTFIKRKLKKPWHVKIEMNKKTTHIGYYRTEKEAHNAYVEVVARLKL